MAFTLYRQAARVVALNEDGEIFLMRAHDPSDRTKPAWWEIPGGGIDQGETSAQAARRELYEEAGIRGDIGPCIWVQRNIFDFAGWHFDQREFIHVASCSGRPGYHPTHLESLEAAAFEQGRWWTLDELLADPSPLLPPNLREHLPPIVAGQIPDEPLDIGELPVDTWTPQGRVP